jgi:penicillin-binding protein 2
MKNFHQKYFAGNTISVGIGQGETQVTPIQLARTLSGIASDGHFVRPHFILPGQLTPDFQQAISDSFPGSGGKDVTIDPDTWTTITDGMAAATTTGTAAAAHLEGVDFAGKTGTAQVVGGGDTHTKGGAHTPNAWFVGMIPRKNPEIVIAVLQEHGDWGSGSALIAQKIAIAYVNKQRKLQNNIVTQPAAPRPAPDSSAANRTGPQPGEHAGPQPRTPSGDQAAGSKTVAMAGIWSVPNRRATRGGTASSPADFTLHTGTFLLHPAALAASVTQRLRAPSLRLFSGARVGSQEAQVPRSPGPLSLFPRPSSLPFKEDRP